MHKTLNQLAHKAPDVRTGDYPHLRRPPARSGEPGKWTMRNSRLYPCSIPGSRGETPSINTSAVLPTRPSLISSVIEFCNSINLASRSFFRLKGSCSTPPQAFPDEGWGR